MIKMIVLYTLLTVVASVGLAQVPVPQAISYQGLITNADGSTAADGTHTVRFTFFDAAVDGNYKWETSALTVNSYRGLFTTIIPVHQNATWDQALFVELTVDGVELSGRIPLTSVPYAFKAQFANIASTMNAAGLTGTISDQRLNIHLQDLADGMLSGSKVGSGIKASNITDASSGLIPNDMLDSDLQQFANTGAILGSKIEDGIAAAYVTDISKGLLPNTILDEDLQDLAIDGLLSPSRLEAGIDAAKISVGTLANVRLDGDLQDLADGTLSASRVEDLDASKITTGQFSADRIPDLDASKITSGELPIEVIPDISASLISSDQVSPDRMPNLPTSKITSGVFDVARIPDLSVAKITTGIFATARIPNLPASKITSGVFDVARIPDLDATKVTSGQFTTGQIPNLSAIKITTGIFDPLRIPNLNASKITTGTLSTALLPVNTVTASASTINKVPYWTSSSAIGVTSMHTTGSTLSIGTTTPLASLTINASSVDAVKVVNTYGNALAKTGVSVALTSNTAGTLTGVDVLIENTGTGTKKGIECDVNSTAASASDVTGVKTSVSGSGVGTHRGLFARASGSGTGEQQGILGVANGTGVGSQTGVSGIASSELNINNVYGVYGSAAGSGNGPHYGVYGTASGLINSYGVYGTATGAGNYAVYSNGNLHVAGNITYMGTLSPPCPSDRKLKKNISAMPPSLEKLMLLKPSNYYFRTDEFKRLALDEDLQYGLIAQDVEQIFPELVTEKVMTEKKDKDGNVIEPELTYKGLDYTSLVPILIKGMQEQQALIEKQQAMINAHEELAAKRQQSIDALNYEMKKLKAAKAESSEKRLVSASINK
jgi:hypothetical protein